MESYRIINNRRSREQELDMGLLAGIYLAISDKF
jgi:hypothetical protein